MTRTFHCVKHKLYTFQTSVSIKQMFWLGALIPFYLCCFWFPIAVSFLSTPLPLPTLVPTHWPHTHTSWLLVASWQVVDIFLAAYVCVDDCSCCVTNLVAGSEFGWGILSGIILVPDIWWVDSPVLFSQTAFFSVPFFPAWDSHGCVDAF